MCVVWVKKRKEGESCGERGVVTTGGLGSHLVASSYNHHTGVPIIAPCGVPIIVWATEHARGFYYN